MMSNRHATLFKLRSQLFASPASTVASVIALALGVWVGLGLLHWLVLDAYWAGSEPSACPDKGAACWPFIRTRMNQFMYGFYPAGERWRINIGLVLVLLPGLLSVMRVRVVRGWRAVALTACSLMVAMALFSGGWLGLARVPTDRWGGAVLTLITVASVFALALPAGILLALGRRSSLPLVRA